MAEFLAMGLIWRKEPKWDIALPRLDKAASATNIPVTIFRYQRNILERDGRVLYFIAYDKGKVEALMPEESTAPATGPQRAGKGWKGADHVRQNVA